MDQRTARNKNIKIKLTLVGGGSCGKSQFIQTLLQQSNPGLNRHNTRVGESRVNRMNTTGEHKIEMNRDGKIIELIIQDTPGDPRMFGLRKICYAKTDLFVFCFAVHKEDSMNQIVDFFLEITNLESHFESVLLVTHSDRRLANSTVVGASEISILAKKINAKATFECSSKNLLSVTRTVEKIVDVALHAQNQIIPVFSEEISTLKQKISYLPALPWGFDTKKSNRLQVVAEIFESELRYLRNLYVVNHIYMEPLTKVFGLPEGKVAEIFSTYPKIIALSERILVRTFEQLEHDEDNQCLGSIFLNLIDRFRCYSLYCMSQEAGETALAKLLDSNAKVKEFYKNAEKLVIEDNDYKLHIKTNEILIFPFQRICRYSLLLQSLRNNTPATHADSDDLNLALEKLQAILNVGNSAKGVFDNLNKIKDICSNFIGNKPNLKTSKELILSGNVRITAPSIGENKPRRVFIFSHCIVICQTLLGKYLLNLEFPLDRLVVTNQGETKTLKYAISLTALKGEKIFIFFKTAEKKTLWFQKLVALSAELERSDQIAPQVNLEEKKNAYLRVSNDPTFIKQGLQALSTVHNTRINNSNLNNLNSNTNNSNNSSFINNNAISINENLGGGNNNNNINNNESANEQSSTSSSSASIKRRKKKKEKDGKERKEKRKRKPNAPIIDAASSDQSTLNVEDEEDEEEDDEPQKTPLGNNYIAKAIAMYDYDAASQDEMSFREGDILYLIVRDELDLWHLCECNGVQALVPSNYISVIQNASVAPSQDLPTGIAICDYNSEDISISAGCTLFITQKGDVNWVLCSYEDQTGWVPSRFIKLQ